MFTIVMLTIFLSLLVGLLPKFGKAFNDEHQRQKDKLETKGHKIPSAFPHTCTADMLSTGSRKKRVSIKVWADAVTIGEQRGDLLTALPIDQIKAVLYQDLTKDGHRMAGLGLVTLEGQYKFFSEGVMAPARLKQTAEFITRAYHDSTGEVIPMSDPDDEFLHQGSANHNL